MQFLSTNFNESTNLPKVFNPTPGGIPTPPSLITPTPQEPPLMVLTPGASCDSPDSHSIEKLPKLKHMTPKAPTPFVCEDRSYIPEEGMFQVDDDIHRNQNTFPAPGKPVYKNLTGLGSNRNFLKKAAKVQHHALSTTDNRYPNPEVTELYKNLGKQPNGKRNFLSSEGRITKKRKLSLTSLAESDKVEDDTEICFFTINWARSFSSNEEAINFFLDHLPSLLDILWLVRDISLFKDYHLAKEKIHKYQQQTDLDQMVQLNQTSMLKFNENPTLGVIPYMTCYGNEGIVARAGCVLNPINDGTRGTSHLLNAQHSKAICYIRELNPSSNPPTKLHAFSLFTLDQLVEFFGVLNSRDDHQKYHFYSLFNLDISISPAGSHLFRIMNEVSQSTVKSYSQSLNSLLQTLLEQQMHYATFSNHNQVPALTSTTMNKKYVIELIATRVIKPRHVASVIEIFIRDRKPVTSIQSFYYGVSFWFYRITQRPLSSIFTLRYFKGLFKQFDLYMPVKGACYWPPPVRTGYWQWLWKNRQKYAPIVPAVGLGLLIGPRTKEAVIPTIHDLEKHPTAYKWTLRKLKNSNVNQIKIIVRTNFIINIDDVYQFAFERSLLNPKGRISCFDDGSLVKVDQYQRLLKGSFGAYQPIHLKHTGDDIKHLGKPSHYTFRKSHIVDAKCQGISEEKLKSMTGHSPTSDVLNKHYCGELNAIMHGGMANIFYSKDARAEILPMFQQLRLLTDLKVKQVIHKKICDEARLHAQMNADRLIEIQKIENETLTEGTLPENQPMTFLPPLHPQSTDSDDDSTDSVYSSDDETSQFVLPKKTAQPVQLTSINLQRLAQMDAASFNPTDLFNDPKFQQTYLIPQHEALREAELKLIGFATSKTFKQYSPRKQAELLQIELKLITENFHTNQLRVIERLHKDLQL